MGYAIEIKDLVKRFGFYVAVNKLNLTIQEGTIFGFLGSNGSGKTTTIRMLCGLLPPTEGHAYIMGHDVVKEQREVQRLIGYMSQKLSLYPDLTAMENLVFYGRLYGIHGSALRGRIDELVDMLDLKERLPFLTGDLSGGSKQNVALACALIHHPKILFLDEPTGGVDPVSRRNFWDCIYRLGADGTTIMVTTHLMDEAEHCQRASLLSHGVLISEGTPQEMKDSIDGKLVKITPHGTSPVIALEELKRSSIVYDDAYILGASLHVIVHGTVDLSFLGRQEIVYPTMDDVFVYYERKSRENKE